MEGGTKSGMKGQPAQGCAVQAPCGRKRERRAGLVALVGPAQLPAESSSAHLGPDEELPARLLNGCPERRGTLPVELDEGDSGAREEAAPELQCTEVGFR